MKCQSRISRKSYERHVSYITRFLFPTEGNRDKAHGWDTISINQTTVLLHAFISSLVAAVKSEAEVSCLYVPATSRAAINKAFPDRHSGMKANKKTCSVYEKQELGDILFPDLWTEIAKCG